MKRKFSRWFNKHFNVEAMKILILFVPLGYLLLREIRQGEFSVESFFDVDILVSFLFVAFCELLAGLVGNFVGRRCEDATKLTEDYTALCKKYPKENFVELGDAKCPVICLCRRKEAEEPYTLSVEENDARYELPAQVAERSDVLMNAHRFSTVYNNRNVRLDDLKQEGNRVTLYCSSTTYFDSLITNRAMDFDWGNGKTIREVYEPGPFLNPLKKSKLSNHLGFNGFVETSDGMIIFVMRYGKVSIGKRTLANSIGASMKTKYCLNRENKFTPEGLGAAIRGEIRDELKFDAGDEEKLTKSIFAFYRDVVEGGKPQFLFYYKAKQNSTELREQFKKALREDRKKKRGSLLTDGKKLIFIPREELFMLELTPGGLKRTNGKKYKMMPSAVASVKLLREYLG